MLELKQSPVTKKNWILLISLIIIGVIIGFYFSQDSLYLKKEGWRTVHSMVITRDLERRNFDIFNTEVYYEGTTVKYVQAFPIYNIIIAAGYKIFGEDERIGRYISILAFSISLFFFFKLLVYYIPASQALFAVFFFSFCHLSLFYKYMFQSTSFEIMLITISLYYLHRHLEDDNNRKLYVTWSFFMLMTFLVRITLLVLLLPLFYLYFRKYGWRFLKRKQLIIFLIVSFVVLSIWYFYAVTSTHPAFRETFITYFTDAFRWLFTKPFYLFYLIKKASGSLWESLTILGFAAAVICFFFTMKNRKLHFLHLWLISNLFLLFLLPRKYVSHPYNHLGLLLPLVAFMVIGGGRLFNSALFRKNSGSSSRIIISVFSLYFILNAAIYFLPVCDKSRSGLEQLARRIEMNTPPDARVIFFARGLFGIWTTEYSYASERSGWPRNFSDYKPNVIMNLVRKGATHLAVIHPFEYQGERVAGMQPWNFASFTLIDSISDKYMLFDLSILNKLEDRRENGTKMNISFGGEIELRKMIISSVAPNIESRIKYLWRALKNDINGNYIFVGLCSDGSCALINRMMGRAFPARNWRRGIYYAESIKPYNFPSAKVKKAESLYLLPLLYEPILGNVILPNKDKEGRFPFLVFEFNGSSLNMSLNWSELTGGGFNQNIIDSKQLKEIVLSAIKPYLEYERSTDEFYLSQYILFND